MDEYYRSQSDSNASEKPTLLVTGSEGVVGQVLVPLLRQQGYRIRGLDLRPGDHGLPPLDLLRREQLELAMHGCSGIIHLAALARVRAAEQDPARCALVNVQGTEGVIRAALAGRARPWVLFASSREVYGACGRSPVVEDRALTPMNCYGKSKAEGEALLTAAAGVGLRVGILRLTNLYGSPLDYPERVIPRFIQSALRGEPLNVEGPAKEIDFLHVQDAARGILMMVKRLELGKSPPPIIHLASGVGISLGTLARTILSHTQSGANLSERSSPPQEDSSFVGDPSRALLELDWKPRIDFQVGLKQLIESLRERTLLQDG